MKQKLTALAAGALFAAGLVFSGVVCLTLG